MRRITNIHFLEDGSEFLGGETVLIQSIFPVDSLENLKVSSAQPVTTVKQQLEITQYSFYS